MCIISGCSWMCILTHTDSVVIKVYVNSLILTKTLSEIKVTICSHQAVRERLVFFFLSLFLFFILLLKDSEFFGIFYCFFNFGTILIIKRFRFYRNLLLFFEFRYYPYYYYYSFFSGHAIGIANLQNRITFSHQTPLIHGPLSDTLQRAFRCWSGLPFWI